MKTRPNSSTPKDNLSLEEPLRKKCEKNYSLNGQVLSPSLLKLYEVISQKDDEIEKLNEKINDQIRDNRFLQSDLLKIEVNI